MINSFFRKINHLGIKLGRAARTKIHSLDPKKFSPCPCRVCGFIEGAVEALKEDVETPLKSLAKEGDELSACSRFKAYQKMALKFWENDEIIKTGRALRNFIMNNPDKGITLCRRCGAVFNSSPDTDVKPLRIDDKIASKCGILTERLLLLAQGDISQLKILVISESRAEWKHLFSIEGCSSVCLNPRSQKFKRVLSGTRELFNLILVDRVLETETVPAIFVEMVSALLAPEGLISIITPDFASRAAAIHHDSWLFFRSEISVFFDWASLLRTMLCANSGLVTADMACDTFNGLPLPGMICLTMRKSTAKIYDDYTIISEGARGDNLLLIPLVKKLKKEGAARVDIITKFPEFIEPSGYFDNIAQFDTPAATALIQRMRSGVSRGVSTRYQALAPVHFSQAYALLAGTFIDDFSFKKKGLFQESIIMDPAIEIKKLPDKPYAVINTMCGSRLKRWSPGAYLKIAQALMDKGISVVTIGHSSDCVEIKGAVNMLGTKDVYSVLAGAVLFIGLDSFHLHAASFFDMPKIIILGSTLWEPVITDPDNTIVLKAPYDCLGCRQRCLPSQWSYNLWCRQMEGNPYESPETLDNPRIAQPMGAVLPPCMEAVKAEDVINKAFELLKREGIL